MMGTAFAILAILCYFFNESFPQNFSLETLQANEEENMALREVCQFQPRCNGNILTAATPL